MKLFQPKDGSWNDYALKKGLGSVLDPNDSQGIKNDYINILHQMAITNTARLDSSAVSLDFGCGAGRISRLLADSCSLVIGCEITKEMICNARQYTPQKGINYLLIDGHNIPIATNSIDLIVTVYVLQYSVKNREIYEKIIKEFARILKIGGKLLLIEQVSFTDKSSGSVKDIIRPENYLDLGRQIRAKIIKQTNIRLGHPGFLERIATFRNLPNPLKGLLIKFILKKNILFSDKIIKNQPYLDWLCYMELNDNFPETK